MPGDPNPQQRVMPTLRMTDYERSKASTSLTSAFRLTGNTDSNRGFRFSCKCRATGWRFF